MTGLLLRIVGNALALYAANFFVSGFAVVGGWKEYMIAGGTLGLLNLIVKPILKTLTFPLILLTLGLFTLVINGMLVWGIDYLFDFILIGSWGALFWGTLVITVMNLLVSHKS